ncbi:hypothetical protein GOODEAATRI_010515, partial [Goodea atripinnis]
SGVFDVPLTTVLDQDQRRAPGTRVPLILQKALVEFFQRVIDQQAKNKMSLNNVSVVMAPSIFIFKGLRSKVTEQQELSMATGTANIVRLLIRYQNLLWTVTCDSKHDCNL